MISSLRSNRWLDAKKIRPGRVKTSRAEQQFARALKSVAEHVGHLIDGFDTSTQLPELMQMLDSYGSLLTPWAETVSNRMLVEINARDKDMWRTLSREIGRGLRQEIENTSVGETIIALRKRQTALITSLPTQAAERVQALTHEALMGGGRDTEIREMILASGGITYNRAKLIARTETANAASTLTQARAMSIGSTHYIWRTVRDNDVRPGHKEMEGKVCEWANPPAVNENGRIMHHHPGQIWNCRCYPQVIPPTFD